MIPENFEYSSPTTLQTALSLLAEGSAKVLAGGMSLIPLMKLRFAAPAHVVDLGRIAELNYVRADNGQIHIGAITTHYDIESSPVLRAQCPLLAEAASNIGDMQVRNRGTIGGSIAHADPAADYPASLLALEAKVVLASAKRERTLSLEEFLVDTMTTALEPGEIVREIIVARETPGAGVAYMKMVHPASGFAIVGVAVRLRNGFARVGVTGIASKAYRARNVEALLEKGASTAEVSAADVAEGVDVNSDLHASAGYRRHLAKVYTARAIAEARRRAGA